MIVYAVICTNNMEIVKKQKGNPFYMRLSNAQIRAARANNAANRLNNGKRYEVMAYKLCPVALE